MGSVAAAVEAVGGIEEEYFLDGIATRYGLVGGTDYSARRTLAGRARRRPGVLPHPDARRAARRPRDLQRRRRRRVEQRVGRRVVHAAEPGRAAAPGRLRGRRRLGTGRRRRRSCARAPLTGEHAVAEAQRPRALRRPASPGRRLLLRHLHAGGAAARAGPPARDRPVGRSRGPPPDRHRRIPVGGAPCVVPDRRAAAHRRVRRVPARRLPELAVLVERGVDARRGAAGRARQHDAAPPVARAGAPRRPRRADHRVELGVGERRVLARTTRTTPSSCAGGR